MSSGSIIDDDLSNEQVLKYVKKLYFNQYELKNRAPDNQGLSPYEFNRLFGQKASNEQEMLAPSPVITKQGPSLAEKATNVYSSLFSGARWNFGMPLAFASELHGTPIDYGREFENIFQQANPAEQQNLAEIANRQPDNMPQVQNHPILSLFNDQRVPSSDTKAGPFIRPPEAIRLTTEKDNVLAADPPIPGANRDEMLSTRAKATIDLLVERARYYGNLLNLQNFKEFIRDPIVRYGIMALGFFSLLKRLGPRFFRYGQDVDEDDDDQPPEGGDPMGPPKSQTFSGVDKNVKLLTIPMEQEAPEETTSNATTSNVTPSTADVQVVPEQLSENITSSTSPQTSSADPEVAPNLETTPIAPKLSYDEILNKILQGFKQAFGETSVTFQQAFKAGFQYLTTFISQLTSSMLTELGNELSEMGSFSWQVLARALNYMLETGIRMGQFVSDIMADATVEPFRIMPFSDPNSFRQMVLDTNLLTAANNAYLQTRQYSTTFLEVMQRGVSNAQEILQSYFDANIQNAQGMISTAMQTASNYLVNENPEAYQGSFRPFDFERIKLSFESLFGQGTLINDANNIVEQVPRFYRSFLTGNQEQVQQELQQENQEPDDAFAEFDIPMQPLQGFIADNIPDIDSPQIQIPISISNQVFGEQGNNENPVRQQQERFLANLISNAHSAALQNIASMETAEPILEPMNSAFTTAVDVYRDPNSLVAAAAQPETTALAPLAPTINDNQDTTTEPVPENKEEQGAITQPNPEVVSENTGNAVDTIKEASTSEPSTTVIAEDKGDEEVVVSKKKEQLPSTTTTIVISPNTGSSRPLKPAPKTMVQRQREKGAIKDFKNHRHNDIRDADSSLRIQVNTSDLIVIRNLARGEIANTLHFRDSAQALRDLQNIAAERLGTENVDHNGSVSPYDLFHYNAPSDAGELVSTYHKRLRYAEALGIGYYQYMYLLTFGYINEPQLGRRIASGEDLRLRPIQTNNANPYGVYSQLFYGSLLLQKPLSADQSESFTLPLSYLKAIQDNAKHIANLSIQDSQVLFRIFDGLIDKVTGFSQNPIVDKLFHNQLVGDERIRDLMKIAKDSKDKALMTCAHVLETWKPPSSREEFIRNSARALQCALLFSPSLESLQKAKQEQESSEWLAYPMWAAGLVAFMKEKISNNKSLTAFVTLASSAMFGFANRQGSGIKGPIGKLKHVYYLPKTTSEIASKVHSLPKPNLKLQPRPIEKCGICGRSKSLLVHDKDPSDITCEDCYDRYQSTANGHYHGGQEMKPIEESANHKHHMENLHHNNELQEAFDSTAPSKLDRFLKNAPHHVKHGRWKHMYGKYYAQHDSHYGPRDLDRLTWLMGVKHHEPESLSPSHKANLVGLGIKHMHSFSNVNSFKLPLSAFKDFNSLKEGLVDHPQVFAHMTV